MLIELLHWYDSPQGEPYYNHTTTTGINSLGTFNDKFRVPDLLLTSNLPPGPQNRAAG